MRLRCAAFHRPLLLAGGMLAATAAPGASQDVVTLRVEENFRREPNGVVLARLGEGASLRLLGTEGNWTQVEVEGWVWLRSLQSSDDPAFDLLVSQVDGENLRSGPSGTILGVLEEGTLLEELGRDPAWARVARVGWIWSASLTSPAPAESEALPSRLVTSAAADPPTGPAARSPGNFSRTGRGGAILTAPDGDTLGVLGPMGDVEVLAREGSWARVRLEGWMWMPETASETVTEETAGSESVEVLDPDALMSNPTRYAGRVVAWTIQFISLERAEAVRTDFFEGETFLLARFGGADGPFVYVAVPTDRRSEVDGLVPLERLAVTGRVRTGASQLTGAPIIDLIDIQRSREDE
ncbi:MAG: hypothetical protein ACPHO4_13495 [Longimicrobiales bacterium]